ncbi:hypothetical protein MBLNU457_1706t1 [Dothideomycetes sp. NU457]
MSSPSVTSLPSINPDPPTKGSLPDHWVGNPPTSFTNPWPSFFKGSHGLISALQTRFGSDRNYVPIPTDKSKLVQVRKPTWGRDKPGWETQLKATWMGHAGFIVELPIPPNSTSKPTRGITILMDAVFADRMSPVFFAGPKRFVPTPCTVAELPEIDIVLISHNHYDHLDIETMRQVYARNGTHIHFFAPLGNKKWFTHASGLHVPESQVTELDWWDQVRVTVDLARATTAEDGSTSDVQSTKAEVTLTCTPSQHFSARSPFDAGHTLWSSFCIQSPPIPPLPSAAPSTTPATPTRGKSLYFSGDTALRSRSTPASTPPCPAFTQIGSLLGPFDLALLPIGCYSPRNWMSNVHASPEDSVEIHRMVKSKKSVGMHYGTIRGGISGQYEPVDDPPRVWREVCEKEGLWETGECGLCEVGETVAV